jgi:hypothetical protein
MLCKYWNQALLERGSLRVLSHDPDTEHETQEASVLTEQIIKGHEPPFPELNIKERFKLISHAHRLEFIRPRSTK